MIATKRKQGSTADKPPGKPTKYDIWEYDAIAHIKKTSALKQSQGPESEEGLVPQSFPSSVSRGNPLESRLDTPLFSRKPQPRISTSTKSQIRISQTHPFNRKSKDTEMTNLSSKDGDEEFTHSPVPPPAPLPPRLPTPKLDDIPEHSFWACCIVADCKYKKHSQGE